MLPPLPPNAYFDWAVRIDLPIKWGDGAFPMDVFRARAEQGLLTQLDRFAELAERRRRRLQRADEVHWTVSVGEIAVDAMGEGPFHSTWVNTTAHYNTDDPMPPASEFEAFSTTVKEQILSLGLDEIAWALNGADGHLSSDAVRFVVKAPPVVRNAIAIAFVRPPPSPTPPPSPRSPGQAEAPVQHLSGHGGGGGSAFGTTMLVLFLLSLAGGTGFFFWRRHKNGQPLRPSRQEINRWAARARDGASSLVSRGSEMAGSFRQFTDSATTTMNTRTSSTSRARTMPTVNVAVPSALGAGGASAESTGSYTAPVAPPLGGEAAASSATAPLQLGQIVVSPLAGESSDATAKQSEL